MSNRKLYLDIIGVGPGHPDWVTPRAHAVLQAAQIVVGWELDLLPVKPWLNGKRVFRQTVKNYRQVTGQVARLARQTRQRVAVLRVGDPCVSSGLKGLLESFHDFHISVVPGISSVQMVAALAKINLDEALIVTFHDYGDPMQKQRELLEGFRAGRHLIVLASPDLKPGPMATFLLRRGLPGRTKAVVASNLTLPDERIRWSTLSGIAGQQVPWLTLTAVLNPAVATDSLDRKTWLRWRRTSAQRSVDGLDS